jgi:hypothetical protein
LRCDRQAADRRVADDANELQIEAAVADDDLERARQRPLLAGKLDDVEVVELDLFSANTSKTRWPSCLLGS